MSANGINRELSNRLLNVSLRGLSMGSKFLLIFVLARFLEPAELGLYGLVAATLGFSALVIGGDYYTYSHRELMSLPRERWGFVLQHQGVATGLLYLVLIPAQLIIFWFDLLPATLMPWFFALLIGEHLAQEFYRLLVVMHAPVVASLMLFVRMGLWVWLLIPLMWLQPEYRSLETVFLSWLVGSYLAVLLSILIIKRRIIDWRWWQIDWRWVQRGFGVGALFLFATMCFKALSTVDRYLVEYLVGTEMLAVYVLYAGIAMAVVSFLDPAVFSFLYPRLVRAWGEGRKSDFRKIMRELWFSTVAVCFILVLVCVLLAPWLLAWTGKEIYLGQKPLLWTLLLSAFIYGISMVPHYGLYARGADKAIVAASASSLVVFLLVTYSTSTFWPLGSAAIGLVAAFTWMGGFKFVVYHRLTTESKL